MAKYCSNIIKKKIQNLDFCVKDFTVYILEAAPDDLGSAVHSRGMQIYLHVSLAKQPAHSKRSFI